MKRELIRKGFDPKSTIIIKRAEKNRDAALRAAATLTHMDRVSLLIGGIISSHAEAIVNISDAAHVPSLILNANAPLGRTKQSFRVYPPIKKLAFRLIESLKSNNVKHAAVLYPHGANLELFNIMRAKHSSGINYFEASYNPQDSQSILAAAKSQISFISSSEESTAVLIFDNFRMVRHLSNMISTSLPGRQIIFAGNQQWRSHALVTPREESLQGAMFVDFIGSYKNLPETIEIPETENIYFTTAQAASRIDYQIIGNRLGTLATEASKFGVPRHLVAQNFLETKNKWDYYFPNDELAFDDQRDSSWPAFLFKIEGESIKESK
jgi:hypothetical protein